MLPRYPLDTSEPNVTLRKISASGADLSHLGAFPKGEVLRLVVT